MVKKYLIILKDLPNNANEKLDVALGLAALEQEVSLLFLNLGVYQSLIPENLKILQALDLYDINNVYIAKTSMENYQLDPNNISVKAKIIDNDFINNLFRENDVVL